MPHEALRSVAAPISRLTDDLRALVDDLIETMHAHHGVGLAAPQIGRTVQVFVADASLQTGCDLVVVNPTLERVSGRMAIVEGCLSLPDTWERIPRWAAIRLKGQDPSGHPLSLEAEGLLAIVIQHELDHLHGLLMTDRLPAPRQQAGQAGFPQTPRHRTSRAFQINFASRNL